MGTGYHGGFGNTLGSTYGNSSTSEESYGDRGIEIPDHLKSALSKMERKGDYITTTDSNSFSMKDISIMSKEAGVEFAKVSINGKSYIIRGDKSGTVIPNSLMTKLKSGTGKLEFHSHPHNNDCVPSPSDMKLMKELHKRTGQRVSTIVTPNGRTSTFDEHGVISTGTVSNTIDKNLRDTYIKMFGGK